MDASQQDEHSLLDSESPLAYARSRRVSIAFAGVAALSVVCIAVITVLVIHSSRDDEASQRAQLKGQLGLGANALGEAAPTFTLPELSGDGAVNFESYRGDIVVLNFWRSDCHPCRAEFPLLREQAPHVQVVGVSTDAVPADGRRFVREEHANWPQALDEQLAVAGAYGLSNSLPQTFFIRANGTIAYHVYGQLSSKLIRQGITAAEEPPRPHA